jgi:Tfp pilus assembly protein PilN
MRAVNLIPDDLRRGSSAAGRSGSAVYVLLGVLGVLVVLATAWGLTGRQVNDRKTELATVEAEAQNAEARAGALQPYAKFAQLRAKRVETVTALSRTRFNWPYALREISRVLPENVWLSTLNGTVAPGAGSGSSSGASGLRGALTVPAVELSGCTMSQKDVARYLARLRSIDGVTRVSLASSEKVDGAATGGAAPAAPTAEAGASDGDCRQGNARIPKFDAVVFFERSTATPSKGTPGAAAAAPAATTPAAGSTPASGTATTPPATTPPADASSSSTPTSASGSSTGSTK